MSNEKTPFAELCYQFDRAKDAFDDKLLTYIIYDHVAWDHYDVSLEIYDARPEARLSEDAQMFLRNEGYEKVYVNHTDGWETHYDQIHKKISKGWRRKRREDGGWLISEKPESWPEAAFTSGIVRLENEKEPTLFEKFKRVFKI